MSDFAIPGLMPIGSPVFNDETSTAPLRISRWITFGETITVTMPEGLTLEGWEVSAHARQDPEAEEPDFDLAPFVSDGPNNKLRIEFTAAEAGALPLGLYRTDILMTHPDGTVLPVIENLLVIVDSTNTHSPTA